MTSHGNSSHLPFFLQPAHGVAFLKYAVCVSESSLWLVLRESETRSRSRADCINRLTSSPQYHGTGIDKDMRHSTQGRKGNSTSTQDQRSFVFRFRQLLRTAILIPPLNEAAYQDHECCVDLEDGVLDGIARYAVVGPKEGLSFHGRVVACKRPEDQRRRRREHLHTQFSDVARVTEMPIHYMPCSN